MKDFAKSRREFLKTTGAMAGAFLLYPRGILCNQGQSDDRGANGMSAWQNDRMTKHEAMPNSEIRKKGRRHASLFRASSFLNHSSFVLGKPGLAFGCVTGHFAASIHSHLCRNSFRQGHGSAV